MDYVPHVRAVLLPASKQGQGKVIGSSKNSELTVAELSNWLSTKFPLDVCFLRAGHL